MAKIQLFSVGTERWGVATDHVMTIAGWREPAALPHAPAPVLGVVSIQGRMLTVLDLAKLFGAEDKTNSTHILALRGDEQLALAITEPGEVTELSAAEKPNGTEHNLVARVITKDDVEIRILNVKELFGTAIHGRERRRRRF
ncbi:MAG TPA: chemotaxis protein CheW [Pyrinomonadaceae bacterium]|nr:chemotaxis protein CheW [Pyrinomonadaceae bacterium]